MKPKGVKQNCKVGCGEHTQMISEAQYIFFNLIKLGIGHDANPQADGIDWGAIKGLSDRQGLTAVILDALNTDNTNIAKTIPTQMKLEWIGEVLQNYEQRYKQYEKAIGSLAGWYNQHGFKMMVLKGYTCAQDWPKPEHRPCGDIDIWLFGRQKDADEVLQKSTKMGEIENQIIVDSSHHHHTVFEWESFSVENHYDFVNVHGHKSSRELEAVFKKLGQDDSCCVDVNGEKMYMPSPNLHALFLIRHMVTHFAAAEITLRQVLDWAFFVKKHTRDIDWKWLTELLANYHMRDFYNCINAICVGDLGFDVRIFPQVQFDPVLKDKVLADIMEPKFTSEAPYGFFNRIGYKWQRWQGNAWKQKMCYPESRWTIFWKGVWTHLLKPASI